MGKKKVDKVDKSRKSRKTSKKTVSKGKRVSKKVSKKVKKTSKYKDDYESIDFWIDRTLFLPRRIVTTSTQGDVYDITFLEPKLNKKLPGTIFAIEVPADFRQNDHPLEPPTPQPADEREASKGR